MEFGTFLFSSYYIISWQIFETFLSLRHLLKHSNLQYCWFGNKNFLLPVADSGF